MASNKYRALGRILQKGTLENEYVFYQRLFDDGHYYLYNKINRELGKVHNNWFKNGGHLNSQNLEQMSKIEANKERDMLEKIFQVDSFKGLEINEDFYKNFVRAINEALNLKKIFERNALLIQETKGQKNVLSFFDGYFYNAWEENMDKIQEEALIFFDKASDETTLDECIDKAINIYMPKILEDALHKWLVEAGLENGIQSTDKAQQDAYVEIFNQIMSLGINRNSNPFINTLYEQYHLDDIVNMIKQKVATKKTMSGKLNVGKRSKQAIQKILGTKSNKIRGQRAGFTYEAFRLQGLEIVADRLRKKGFKVQVDDTGKKGNQSADQTMYIGFDTSVIQDILDDWTISTTGSLREYNYDKIREIQERLKNVDNNGYVVYVSDKNYALGESFKERGGFAAKSQNYKNFKNIMMKVEKNFSLVMPAILQCIPGAIAGGTGQKEQWEEEIANYIAFMLFDDFETIGKDMVNTGNINYIHLMDLNGVMIPLSLILFLLSKAMKQAENIDQSSIVVTDISLPDYIMYPGQGIYGRYTNNAGEKPTEDELIQMWNEQRKEAIAKTTIQIHFLKDLREILQEYVSI